MPREDTCAHCGSNDTQAGFDSLQCLVCGHRTDMATGSRLPKEPVFDKGNGHHRYLERPK